MPISESDQVVAPPLRGNFGLEDKIVQKATVELLTAIYEQDFLNCSYGFRPGRGAQDALDEVDRAICREPTSCVLELDITSYFGASGQAWRFQRVQFPPRQGE